MHSQGPAERDAAVNRLKRARTWVALGAAGLTGAGTIAAATSFRGHQAEAQTTAPSGTTQPAPSGADSIPLPQTDDGSDGLAPPQQAPQPALPSQPPATTSGGS
jgi:hypothetical protein